jgi:hypothetical protein
MLRFGYTLIHKVIHRFCGWKMTNIKATDNATFLFDFF